MVEVRPLATSSWTTDQISPTIPASRRVDSGHSVPDHNITSHNENKSTIGFFLKKKNSHSKVTTKVKIQKFSKLLPRRILWFCFKGMGCCFLLRTAAMINFLPEYNPALFILNLFNLYVIMAKSTENQNYNQRGLTRLRLSILYRLPNHNELM